MDRRELREMKGRVIVKKKKKKNWSFIFKVYHRSFKKLLPFALFPLLFIVKLGQTIYMFSQDNSDYYLLVEI